MFDSKKYFTFLNLLFVILCHKGISQSMFLNNVQNSTICYENNIYQNTNNHTIIRPLLINEVYNSNYFDSSYFKTSNNKLTNWLSNKNLIYLKNKNNGFILNPVITDMFNNKYYYTENGFQTNAWLGKNIAFSLTYSYIAFKPSNEVELFSDSTGFVPHFGKADISNEYTSLQNVTGSISWQVADFMNLQIGKDKSFWGDGYRSLYLSDNSNAYPFFKGTVNIWKVKYVILYSFLKERKFLDNNSSLENKYSASHILSWNIGNRLNFNMFETVIWRGKDSLGNRGFDVNYMNPIIFYRPVEFSLGSPDNVIMGIGGRLRVFKTTHLYGQFLLDEFKLSEIKAGKGWWGNKFGIQAGIKTFKLFGLKNLFALSELNIVRPFTYSHDDYFSNYGNYNQPLAHPSGANFVEGIAQIRYEKKRLAFTLMLQLLKQGRDSDSTNTGFNIYRSYNNNRNEYGNKILQGVVQNRSFIEISVSYVINPQWQLWAKIGYRKIMEKQSINSSKINSNLIFFGIYTAIGNREGLY